MKNRHTTSVIQRIIVTVILFCTFSGGYAATGRYYFEQISLNEGLTQSTVKAIFRDHIGMVWAGTRDGLNRYDGQNIRSYYHDPSKPGSLPDNDIYFITEDSANRLWVGTQGVVCRYNRRTDSFEPQLINGVALSLRNIFRKGAHLYSTTGNSLLVHDAASDSWSEVPFHGDETNLTAATRIEFLKPGVLLMASRWKGLFLCDMASGKLTRAPFYKGVNILDVFVDSRQRIWVSENGKGVSCYDVSGRQVIELSLRKADLRADKIMDILEHNGDIWLATDGEGILVYSGETDQVVELDRQRDNASMLRVNSVLLLYTDPFGVVWMGSVRNGLLAVRTVNVNSYRRAPLHSKSGLSEPTVLGFYEESDRSIWIGTDGQGINLFDPVEQQFTHYPATFGTKVTALTAWNERELLVSIYNDGLHVFDKQSGRLRAFPVTTDDGHKVFTNGWIGLSMVRYGDKLYIADESVYELSQSTGKVKKLPVVKPGEGGVKVQLSVNSPAMLVIVTNQCVYGYYMHTGTVRCFADVSDLGAGSINAAAIDKGGALWLGMSKGLYRIDARGGKAKQIFAGEIKTVSSLVTDGQSSLWFSSGTRLYRYHLLKKQLYEYGKANGVHPEEYLPKSKLLGKKGDIYMGGVSGFIRIDSSIPFPEVPTPVIELLDIQLDGSMLPSGRLVEKSGTTGVSVPWNHTSLQFNLFVNTPALSSLPQVRYRLDPLNESWQILENQFIRFQNLPSGNYKVLIQYEVQNEQWSESVVVATLHVGRPWWKTWWFYLIVSCVVLVALWSYRHQAVQRARQQMELEMQHRENELSEQKIRFLINISHELRTPLTLVYAPLRRLVREENTPEIIKPLLALMYKHVMNMKNMIDMVLDIRKIEMTGDTTLNRQNVEINHWLQQLSDDFMPEAEARGVRIVFTPGEEVKTMNIDSNRCEKVVMNLMMNALKFSDEGMVVELKSQWLGNRVRISVEDQGPGVAPEEVSRLFTRFYQASNQKGGTGIGLSYARSQVELHGGTIGYTPKEPTGSVFWFELPGEFVNDFTSRQSISRTPVPIDSGPTAEVQQYASEGFRKLSVLVVEDEPDLLRYMKESLEPSFKKVFTASRGDDALHKVHTLLPDFVVSDVMMPVMDGFELCRNIKTDVKVSHIPVVLLTALGDSDSSLTGYKMGADVYLSKPFGMDLLLAIMANLMRNRELLRRQYAGGTIISTLDITYSNADEKFLTRLTQHIDRCMEESEIRIDELASEMAMSRTTFYTKVKALTGMSANNFVIDYKMKKAVVLLSETDLPVQEIALKLGFRNQRYFSTVFKSVTGNSPTKWRDGNAQSQSKL